MRDWIGRCLKEIPETGHMKIANGFVDMIKAKSDLDYWGVYTIVSS